MFIIEPSANVAVAVKVTTVPSATVAVVGAMSIRVGT
jgi:hypothetical protein